MPKKKPRARRTNTGSRTRGPSRKRAEGSNLSRLRPPGEHYRDWYDVPRTDRDGTLPDDPRLTGGARELLGRLMTLGPRYGGSFPHAAIVLDTMLDTGRLMMMQSDGRITAVDPQTFGAGGLSAEQFREAVHELHAAAALLVADEGYVRLVASRPDRPGGRWIHQDEPEARQVPSICIPTQAADELSVEQYGVLGILRDPRTDGPEDAIRKLTARSDEFTVRQTRDLVDAVVATEWVDVKGCDACPNAAHCTREDRP
jgi:hypothetical protein